MATTNMQFGQSAINVVLNEGQLPAKIATDTNGNTVLVGVDGAVIPTLGANTITVGAGGMYPSTTALFDELRTDTNMLSAISSNVYTCTVTQNSKLVTAVSGGTFDSADTLRHGDFFSIDNSTWYMIDAIYSDGTLILETPYLGATATLQPVYLARPNYRSVLLLPGVHSAINMDTVLPVCVSIDALPGAVITGGTTALTGGLQKAQIIYPKFGHVMARNLAFFNGASSVSSIGSTRTGGGVYADAAASVIEEFGFRCKNEGVDSWSPYGRVGKVRVESGFYEAINDNQFMITTGGALFTNSTFVGNAVALVETAGIMPLQQRMFSAGAGGKFTFRGCSVFLNHPVTNPATVSMLFGTDQAATYILDNCYIEYNLQSKSGGSICTKVSTAAAAVVGELNHSTIKVNGSGGTFNLVGVETYTGAGALTLNLCNLGGAADGGGGTFAITKNSCVA